MNQIEERYQSIAPSQCRTIWRWINWVCNEGVRRESNIESGSVSGFSSWHGIGGARGKGVLYENGAVTAVVTLSQLSIGFQWGGQAYSEFIFFETAAALADFKRGNYELGAQASAVAIKTGASADAEFNGGMAIFTQAKGGLMYEASVGGQKFKVEAKD